MASTTIRATCLCGRHQGVVSIASQLPIESASCSCATCRHTSGVLFMSYLPLTDKPDLADEMKQYQTARAQRYFCGGCGSHMLRYNDANQSWAICAGVVDSIEEHERDNSSGQPLQHFTSHRFLADTVDGALVAGFAGLPSSKAAFCLHEPGRTILSGLEYLEHLQRASEDGSEQRVAPPDTVLGCCHCGGVQYRITRPNAESQQGSSPWPDLIVPYHSGSAENPHNVSWWLRAHDKYLAGTCMCRSCRLSCGSPVQTWAFIPRVNIVAANGSPIDFTQGSLSSYESSEGVYRNFCSVCGASAFWHCLERPDVIDVSVGLLRAPEGARASSWLHWWTDRVSFKEKAIDNNLADDLEESLSHLSAVE